MPHIAVLQHCVHHVHHTCFVSELFTTICRGMFVVVVFSPAVVIAEKVNALSSVFALRSSFALQILSHQLVFFCKMSSIYKQRNAFMVCLQQLACIFSLVAIIVGSDEISEASQILNCLSDMVYCTVCACMQTQHKLEMDKRDGRFGPQPMAVPPPQQMSRVDQPYPPPVGYPQGYGQTPYGCPQGQPQGYNSQFQPRSYAAQGSPHQGYNYQNQQQGYPPQGSPYQAYPPQGAPHQGYNSQYQPQGYPPQGPSHPVYPSQSNQPQGNQAQGSPPQGQPQSHLPQGESQNHPPQGSLPKGQPSQPQAPTSAHPPSEDPGH
ncbi:uncharacterized protein LOC141675056 isoform X2 [Apium graveolens]|uniref:uncharacterized protein LOC141675056 isoform X2 n=2 Tax=Apium graveolens TaxID=4045 RepID=UPI003D790946